MDFSMGVSLWGSIGLLLIAGEIFTGTFYLLSFGVAAILVAILSFLIPMETTTQMGAFAVMSVLSLLMIRKRFHKQKSQGFQADINQMVKVEARLEPNQEGTVQYQGSPWSAINIGTSPIGVGDMARIIKVESNRLHIQSSK